MAEILDLEEQGSISLEEAVAQLDEQFSLDQDDSCLAVAPIIKRLGENKQWFADLLQSKLIDLLKGMNSASGFLPTSQQFMIASSAKGYLLRAIVWMPPSSQYSDKVRKNVFTENLYHDHTFDLLTLSLLGPGYEADFFQYNNSAVTGIVGEEVEIEKQGRIKFKQGRMLYMRKNRDIHAQFAPSEISVSLNLIPFSDDTATRRQYRFDLISHERARITRLDYSGVVFSQLALIEIAEVFGNENTANILTDIAKNHNNSAAQLAALKALHIRYSYSADEILRLSSGNKALTKSIDEYLRN